MQKQQGFTLLELMISLAVVGIIAAIALPSYRQSVLKTNRIDAHITMASLATQQEKFYFTHNNYTGDFADIVAGAASGAALISDEGQYSIALSLPDADGNGVDETNGWIMQATAINEQADDTACATMSITSQGVKTARDSSDAVSSDCWR